jgi:4-diphosphocytidyl-2-C-methyl-D-erythritol kinase
LLNALASGDIEKAGKLLHNDLQEAVERFHPEIAGLQSELMRAGARGALMTGSGSAVFGLAANRSEAEEIARRLPPDCGTVFVVSSLGAPEDERNG